MPTVLVIEDDQAIREALVEQLSGSGFDVQAAGSGLAGVEQLTSGAIDVVVLDSVCPTSTAPTCWRWCAASAIPR